MNYVLSNILAVCLLFAIIFYILEHSFILSWYFWRTRAKAKDMGLLDEFDFAFRELTPGPGSWRIILQTVGFFGIRRAYREAARIRAQNLPMRSAEEWLGKHERMWHMQHDN
jgi:hypothetical protein